MSRVAFVFVLMVAGLLLAANGMAQQQELQQSPALKSQQAHQGQELQGAEPGQQLQWAQKASDIFDKKIISSDGKEIGTAKDLVIGKDGKIEYVILSTGGVFGIGSDKIAISWDKFRSTGNINQLVADVTQSDIERYAGKKMEGEKGSSQIAKKDSQKKESMTLANVDAENARQFMGQKVVGKKNEELGKVKDLLTKEDNKPMYVVIQDESQRLHPVPAQLVRTSPNGQKILSADLDKQAFLSSPSFDQPQLPDQQQWEPSVRGYFQGGEQGGRSGQQQQSR